MTTRALHLTDEQRIRIAVLFARKVARAERSLAYVQSRPAGAGQYHRTEQDKRSSIESWEDAIARDIAIIRAVAPSTDQEDFVLARARTDLAEDEALDGAGTVGELIAAAAQSRRSRRRRRAWRA